MTDDATAAGGEALSVDEAASLLGGADEHEDQDAARQAGDDRPDRAGDDEEGADDADGGGGGVKPPPSWDAEGRALFASLPPEAQEVIAGREAERDRAVSLAQQEAAEARRSAEAAGEAAPYIEQAIARASHRLRSQYEDIDWLAWAAQDPAGCQAARQDYEQEVQVLQQMEEAREAAETLQHHSFLAREAALLPKLVPDLVDPREGEARKAKLGGFLLQAGFTPERIARASASDLALAYDAMRWREAQAGLTHTDRAGPAGEHRTIRPTAAQPLRSSQARRASDALARLSRSGSIDDAVAYLKSRG
jgi:hypothetical protein